MRKRNRKAVIRITSVIVVFAVCVINCGIYLGDYYRADAAAIAAYATEHEVISEKLDDGTLVYEPEGALTGFIFYPGGKVEYTAYEPLMRELASAGVLCVLVEMPFHLAVLDVNAADGIQERYPDIEQWYIGGHSLGGAMAASYLKDHVSNFEGLVLLGAYSTADLSGTDLKTISIYGSEDQVLSREKYEDYKSNLPDDFAEIVIEGGCHAYFGMYGAQEGDGTPAISNVEQIQSTADEILKIIEP